MTYCSKNSQSAFALTIVRRGCLLASFAIFPHRILKVLASVLHPGYNISAMKSTSRYHSPVRHAAVHRRPAQPIRDFKDYSPFEKIVFGCMAPAALIFNHLDETSMYSHDAAEKNLRLGLIYFALAEMAVGLCIGSVLWCVLKCVALALRKVQRPTGAPAQAGARPRAPPRPAADNAQRRADAGGTSRAVGEGQGIARGDDPLRLDALRP